MDNNNGQIRSPIRFEDYNRITDVLMYLNDNMTLNFTVTLTRSVNGERRFFQFETVSGADKYGSELRNVKRIMNFYFVIDCKDDFTGGVVLRAQDVELLTRLIEQRILPWFFGDKTESAFQFIDNNLALKTYEPVTYAQSENKYIVFEPIIYSDEEKSTRGIRITLQSGRSADLEIDKFMGLLHILKSDMYSAACNMVSYVKTEPYGVNTFKMSGLGAPPASMIENGAGTFHSNSFLDNAKSKE
jgi:hypothetical protein